MILLSILIPTIPIRLVQCQKLIKHICQQIEDQKVSDKVEIIAYYDNKFYTVAQKRQKLLELARGEYLVYVDDDDWVASYYIKDIWPLLVEQNKKDMILYDMETPEGVYHFELMGKYSRKYVKNNTFGPRHIHIIKSQIAKKHQFDPYLRCQEDLRWIKNVRLDIKSISYIKKPLYIYRLDIKTSETRPYSAECNRKISTLPEANEVLILDNFWDLSSHQPEVSQDTAVIGIWNSLEKRNKLLSLEVAK